MSHFHNAADFLFICGAVGSGNTFMFNCLTQDADVYGVNEDAFGSTLERLLRSDEEMGKCPHSAEAFREFLYALKRDRRTLILKTPSNLRRLAMLREHVQNTRFVLMIREPHAAIASGLSRAEPNVETVAKLWLSDCQFFQPLGDDSVLVTFEELACEPAAALARVARIHPVSPPVVTYAQRVNHAERSGPEWWKARVDEATQAEIETWVSRLSLLDHYRAITNVCGPSKLPAHVETYRVAGTAPRRLADRFVHLKKIVYQGYYRFVR